MVATGRACRPSGGRPSVRVIVSADQSGPRGDRRRRFRLFRKCLFGYNPLEVDRAIEARDSAIEARDAMVRDAGERATAAEARVGADRDELQGLRAEAAQTTRRIEELEHVAARLATMVVDRDRELRRVRAELKEALERDDDGVRAFAAIAEDLETVRRQARTQATRIRLRALREAAELAERVAEVEDADGEARGRLIERLEEAIERVGVEVDEDEEELAARARMNGHAEREPGDLFDGMVEVEVGPLSDFSQLVGFEDAAGAIGATSEISVKRFTGGRATLAMRFKHPVELLRELEERAPFEFRVRDMRPDRVVLDLDE
jgi:hypothetical protein